jgi:transposase
MKVTTLGIDLAKQVLQLHGVDEAGRAVLRRQVRREQLLALLANMPPMLIGMEACGSAHHWARQLQALGHTVRLMAPQFVKPYVKSNKNDAADAQAICEAVGRPHMRFVAIKTVEQQAVLSLHRVRQGFVRERTACANRIRGLLAEFGLVVPQGIAKLPERVPALLEQASQQLPAAFVLLIERLLVQLRELHRQASELEAQIKSWHRQHPDSRRLEQVPGIGALTASAFIAGVGDARQFHNARQVGAWLGIVPRQHASGGKERLLGISKRGDAYLRTLLIHGARAVIKAAQRAPERADPWLLQLLQRKSVNVAAVALANKNARIAWAMLAHQRDYERERHAAQPA